LLAVQARRLYERTQLYIGPSETPKKEPKWKTCKHEGIEEGEPTNKRQERPFPRSRWLMTRTSQSDKTTILAPTKPTVFCTNDLRVSLFLLYIEESGESVRWHKGNQTKSIILSFIIVATGLYLLGCCVQFRVQAVPEFIFAAASADNLSVVCILPSCSRRLLQDLTALSSDRPD
jgi:hypothetical protein